MRATGVGVTWALLLSGVFSVLATLAAPSPGQQLGPDAAAMALLESARRAHNEGKYSFAADRFREFLKLYAGHRETPAAHYGLAVTLMESPKKDYATAISTLQQVIGRQDFAERPFALFYLGSAERAQGEQSLRQAEARPRDANNLRQAAARQFEEAARHLAAAGDAFATRVKRASAEAGTEQAAADWLIRARCEQCAALLHSEKYKEAAELSKGMLAEKALEKSPLAETVLYQHGYAHLARKDYQAAANSLGKLAPFRQEFGPEARYLLARACHLAGRRAEAAEHYKTLRDDDAAQRKEAAEALRKADKLGPDEKSRLESIVAAPAAENVVRSAFYGAALLLEQGRAQDAREALAAFVKTYPDSALADEAELRQAYCLLELRRFAEVRRSLEDLQKRPQLADRALWWLARAEWASASPSNAQAARTATDLLGRAADRAGELGKQDREAKSRRGEILLDLAEIQYATKAYRDAAATCQKVLADSASPERAEEASARLAAALHLSGQYKASDDACQKFERAYTNSTRLPTILFYEAENARLIALDPPADKGRNKQDVRALSEEAVKRYRRLLKDHPAMPTANLARFGLASVQCQMGQYAEALAALAEIPAAERTGELLAASCLEADCRLRTLPQEPSDAVPAADLIDRLRQAAKLLEGCVAAQGDGPEAADALMKTGHCYQRIASLLADAAEQKAMLVQARQAYDRSLKDRGKTSEAAQAAAVFERAKCLALLGEAETAAGDLARFQSDPWRGLPVAPAAMIFWSELNRAQGSAPEAAKVLAQYRSYFEAGRGARPDQSQWIAALQLEQAMALRESGKFSEARTLLENLLRQFEKRPEAALARREIQQCRREQLAAAVVAAHEALGKPEVKSEQRAALAKALEDGQNSIRPIAESAKAKAAELAKSAGSQAHLQALYEAACCYGTLAEAEIETARQKLHKQAVERIAPDPKKKSGAPGAKTVVPPAPVGDVPAQPSEKTARELYAALIAAAGVTPLAARAKLELAELHASRGESADAVRLWQQVLKEHPDSPWAEAAKQRLAALQ